MAGHLTNVERDRIAQLHHQGFLQDEIAEHLKRSPSTISRELQRNCTGRDYFAAQAHETAQARRRCRPLERKLDRPELQEEVRRRLAHYESPEQIAGAQRRAHPHDRQQRVCLQTIYTWIKQHEDSAHFETFLRRRGKRPARRKTPGGNGCARIKDRPEVIEQRLRLGDFEGDTVLGPPGTGGLVTVVDRRSRYTIVVKIQSKDADHVHRKIKERLKVLSDEQRRSITFDNGTEFARCHRLEKHLGIKLYFADPGCPYQRGTNENTNGLIRQFFPKGTNFRTITHQEVRQVEKLLNDRPRKCLGYATPAEVFSHESTVFSCD